MSLFGKLFDVFLNPQVALGSGGASSGPVNAASTVVSALTPQPPEVSVPPPPVIEPPAPMPTPNDAAMRNARRKATALQQRRRGRASTILTTPFTAEDTLG